MKECFSLVELQLKPNQIPFKLVFFWEELLEKYTTTPEEDAERGRVKGRDVSLMSHPTVTTVEHNGSGVELRTLDCENPGSNPVLRC